MKISKVPYLPQIPAKPIDLIFDMLVSKRAEEFLAPLQPYVRNIVTVPTRGEVPGYTAQDLAEKVADDFKKVAPIYYFMIKAEETAAMNRIHK